jgi:hypothetical protein
VLIVPFFLPNFLVVFMFVPVLILGKSRNRPTQKEGCTNSSDYGESFHMVLA